MPKPVVLKEDTLELEISLLKGKYVKKEKAPFIQIKNKEIDLELRLIMEDFL